MLSVLAQPNPSSPLPAQLSYPAPTDLEQATVFFRVFVAEIAYQGAHQLRPHRPEHFGAHHGSTKAGIRGGRDRIDVDVASSSLDRKRLRHAVTG